MKKRTVPFATTLVFLSALSAQAGAGTAVKVSPRNPGPGDAVLVTVTGTKETPKGKAAGDDLRFFAVVGGYQAVFAVPIEKPPTSIDVTIAGVDKADTLQVKAHTFPETSVVVEEEFANPPAEARDRIDADNKAIRGAFRDSPHDPLYRGRFQPTARGRITSPFGEWRTFNDGHRSQHLGLDLAARKGAPVKAINDGKVLLVRDCFLAGGTVVIAHGGGMSSAYFHLDAITVEQGKDVKRGTVLGRVGMTGRTTGPHVHLSVWVPGGFADPAGFLRLKLKAPPKRPDQKPAASK